MTAIEKQLSSCTFSDALYVTADEGRDDVISDELTANEDGVRQIEVNRKLRTTSNIITDTSSEYFSTQTHQSYSSSSADDSGLSCTPPLMTPDPNCQLPSSTTSPYDSCYPADVELTTDVDIELLQKTLEDSDMFLDDDDNDNDDKAENNDPMTLDRQDNQDEKNYINNDQMRSSGERNINRSNSNANSSKDSDQTISGGRKSSTSNNSFIIVATSHKRHLSPSSSSTSSFLMENNGNDESRRRPNNDYDEKAASSWRHVGDESTTSSVYQRLESDSSFGFEQPSMEYEDAYFEPCAQSSPSKDNKQQKREKIFIRELSFDELQDIKGWLFLFYFSILSWRSQMLNCFYWNCSASFFVVCKQTVVSKALS